MASFKTSFFSTGPDRNQPSSRFQSPFHSLMFGSVKALISIALFFIGLAVLVLALPEVLAFFVAGICFLIALYCLQFAWRIHKASRSNKNQPRHINVDVFDVDKD